MMRVEIHDREALVAVSPLALSAYARSAGWSPQARYREVSDIYVGEGLPEIIVPRTEHLGDYASVVARLIQVFGNVVGEDELSVYRELVTADRDVVRLRAGRSQDGSVTMEAGVDLVRGARDMLLAAACSLEDRKAAYRAGANKRATRLMNGLSLGQTEQGSFVVTVLTPVVPPRMSLFPEDSDADPPIHRRLTLHLIDALGAVRRAMGEAAAGRAAAFADAVECGISANLCDALVQVIEPFPTLDVGVAWARSRPMARLRRRVRFGRTDAAILREAARSLRARAPRFDVLLCGYARQLDRDEGDEDGTVRLRARVGQDQTVRSVTALLDQRDYERAVQAHKDRVPIILGGDLDRTGHRWRLLNARLEQVIPGEDMEESSPAVEGVGRVGGSSAIFPTS